MHTERSERDNAPTSPPQLLGLSLIITLYYRPDGPVGPNYSVFAHLLGAPDSPAIAYQLFGQDDGDPCRGPYPMELWRSVPTVVGRMIIPVSTEAPPGSYELVVGL